MVTLADVARVSATSRSTASRALKGDPRISASTSERVHAVAKALGYRPNMAARTLATGRSGIYGLIVPSTQLMGDPYGARLVGAIASAAGDREGGVMVWLSHDRPSRAVQHTISNGLIDGLIVSILAQDDPWVDELLDSGLPCVLIGRLDSRDQASYATVDNITPTRALMAHLREQGYRRLATIRGPVGNADAEDRYSVFLAAVGGAAELDANLVAVASDFSYTSGYTAATALLRHRPDCIVAGNDELALGAVDAIHAAGLRIPDDIGVTGFDDLRAARPDAGLTTVHHDVTAIGREAVAILLDLLGGAPGPIRRTVPASLVVRQSTRRVAGPG